MYQIHHSKTLNTLCEHNKFEYEMVCMLDVPSLQKAFEMSQNDFSDDYAALGKRSTSVGDIISHNFDYYMVMPIGFKKVPESVLYHKEFTGPKVLGKIDLDMKTTADDVSVERVGSMIKFSVPVMIDKSQAYILQERLGYPAAGYGLYNFSPDYKQTTWTCQSSCD